MEANWAPSTQTMAPVGQRAVASGLAVSIFVIVDDGQTILDFDEARGRILNAPGTGSTGDGADFLRVVAFQKILALDDEFVGPGA